MAGFRLDRFLLMALLLTSAAVAVSAEDDDIDRTDFSDPALTEDVKVEAQGPHSDIETTYVLPDCPDGKVPIGGTSDLLVALANGGSKMFTISAIEAKLLRADGTVFQDLGRTDYSMSLGPLDQRSVRYPIELDDETALGTYTLTAKAFYSDKAKSPFFSDVVKESIELVPAPPDRKAQMQMLQVGLGGVGGLLLVVSALRLLFGGSADKSKGGGSKAKPAKATGSGSSNPVAQNEWLKDTLAVNEGRSPKKTSRKK